MKARLNEAIVDSKGGLTLYGLSLFQGVEAIERKLRAATAVADATGGGTVDTQARAELVAIKAALA